MNGTQYGFIRTEAAESSRHPRHYWGDIPAHSDLRRFRQRQSLVRRWGLRPGGRVAPRGPLGRD